MLLTTSTYRFILPVTFCFAFSDSRFLRSCPSPPSHALVAEMVQSFHASSDRNVTRASESSSKIISVAGQVNEGGSQYGKTDNTNMTQTSPSSTHLSNGLNGQERASTSAGDDSDNIAR
jgi:hypothetical protein